MSTKPSLLPLLTLLLTAFTPVWAHGPQNDHHGWRPGEPRVILFERPDFSGGAIVLYPGDVLENLAGLRFDDGRRANDRISSIKVEGGAEVTVFLDAQFRGPAVRLDRDLPRLTDLPVPGMRRSWDDQISSIRVELHRGAPGGPDVGRPGRGGGDPEKLIRRAYQDVLLREPDAAGFRTYRTRLIEQGWTEQMMRDDLRRSAEYRGPVVNELIRRAYRDLLGREPDPRGVDHYRNQIIDKGMTEQGMRDDLMRSEEYRNRQRNPLPPPTSPGPGHDRH